MHEATGLHISADQSAYSWLLSPTDSHAKRLIVGVNSRNVRPALLGQHFVSDTREPSRVKVRLGSPRVLHRRSVWDGRQSLAANLATGPIFLICGAWFTEVV
jgi:hypothetical protein